MCWINEVFFISRLKPIQKQSSLPEGVSELVQMIHPSSSCTSSCTLVEWSSVLIHLTHIFRLWESAGNLMQTQGDKDWGLGSNLQPSWCEVVALVIKSLCCPLLRVNECVFNSFYWSAAQEEETRSHWDKSKPFNYKVEKCQKVRTTPTGYRTNSNRYELNLPGQ